MKKHELINPTEFLGIMSQLGLDINAMTGGIYHKHLEGSRYKRGYARIKVTPKTEKPFSILDGRFFLKTLSATEDTLNIKLFN